MCLEHVWTACNRRGSHILGPAALTSGGAQSERVRERDVFFVGPRLEAMWQLKSWIR